MVSLAMLSLLQVMCGLLSDAFNDTGNMWSPWGGFDLYYNCVISLGFQFWILQIFIKKNVGCYFANNFRFLV